MLTDDELLALNRCDDDPIVCETDEDILRFARAVEQASYTAAIKACEHLIEAYDRQQDSKFLTDDGKMLYEGMWGGATNCVEAIRSLMEQLK